MNRDEYEIRFARLEDANQITQAINSVAAEGVWLSSDNFSLTPRWMDALHQSSNTSSSLILVPILSNQVIGWCRLFSYDIGSKSRHVTDMGIGILKEFRRRGLGTMLVEKSLFWARERGYEKVTLDSFATNEPALRLFAKRGFQITGRRHRQSKINGVYVDQILMEKFLV